MLLRYVHTNALMLRRLKAALPKEIYGIEGHDANGALIKVLQDEASARNPTMDLLAALRPVFDPVNGTVTAGLLHCLDGASAMLDHGRRIKARAWLINSCTHSPRAVAGCDAAIISLRPSASHAKVLARAGITVADLDVIELLTKRLLLSLLPCVKDLGFSRCS